MDDFILNEDIKVICVPAESFPDGIKAAHDKLDEVAPVSPPERRHFGISWGLGSGNVAYKAAATELEEGEAEKLGLEKFTIRKGRYSQELVEDFMNNIPNVAATFKKLLAGPDVDPDGYCLEWYFNENDMKCMVKLKS